jgi:hypothetical protein
VKLNIPFEIISNSSEVRRRMNKSEWDNELYSILVNHGNSY